MLQRATYVIEDVQIRGQRRRRPLKQKRSSKNSTVRGIRLLHTENCVDGQQIVCSMLETEYITTFKADSTTVGRIALRLILCFATGDSFITWGYILYVKKLSGRIVMFSGGIRLEGGYFCA